MTTPSTATLGPPDKKIFNAEGTDVDALKEGSGAAPSEIQEKQQVGTVAKDERASKAGNSNASPSPSLRVVRDSVDLTCGQQQQFKVEGAEFGTAKWESNPSGTGTLQNGTYTAPSEIPASQRVNIVATENATARMTRATDLGPSITSITPSPFDHAKPPTELEINGTNFVSGCKVNINGSTKSVTQVTPTRGG